MFIFGILHFAIKKFLDFEVTRLYDDSDMNIFFLLMAIMIKLLSIYIHIEKE